MQTLGCCPKFHFAGTMKYGSIVTLESRSEQIKL